MTETSRGIRDNWAIVFAIAGAGNLLIGFWMLWDPEHWYFNLPANVPGTGPLNEHFIRDIGCTFTLVGAWLLVGMRRPHLRFAAMATAAGWFGMHALVHLLDQARGLFGPEQIRYDLTAVYGPTLLLIALAVALRRRSGLPK